MTTRVTTAAFATIALMIGATTTGCSEKDAGGQPEPSGSSVTDAESSPTQTDESTFGTGDDTSFTYAQEAAANSDLVVLATVGKPVGSYSGGGVEVEFVQLKVRRTSAKSALSRDQKVALAVPADSDYQLAKKSQILFFGELREDVPGVTAVTEFLVVNGGESGLFHVSGGRATAAADSMTGLVTPGDERLSVAVRDLWSLARAKDA